MYAVVRTGGKQYRVAEGDVLRIERLELAPGDQVEFNEVLMIGDGENTQLGAPLLAGAKVVGEVRAQGRADKVKIIKFRRRKHFMKRQGHRQYYTEVKVTGIQAS